MGNSKEQFLESKEYLLTRVHVLTFLEQYRNGEPIVLEPNVKRKSLQSRNNLNKNRIEAKLLTIDEKLFLLNLYDFVIDDSNWARLTHADICNLLLEVSNLRARLQVRIKQ